MSEVEKNSGDQTLSKQTSFVNNKNRLSNNSKTFRTNNSNTKSILLLNESVLGDNISKRCADVISLQLEDIADDTVIYRSRSYDDEDNPPEINIKMVAYSESYSGKSFDSDSINGFRKNITPGDNTCDIPEASIEADMSNKKIRVSEERESITENLIEVERNSKKTKLLFIILVSMFIVTLCIAIYLVFDVCHIYFATHEVGVHMWILFFIFGVALPITFGTLA